LFYDEWSAFIATFHTFVTLENKMSFLEEIGLFRNNPQKTNPRFFSLSEAHSVEGTTLPEVTWPQLRRI
jgi:hypothetical protein